jgi:GMP synthase (glutamine-hydrolysing)
MSANREALIVTNIRREQPGTFTDILKQRGWQSTIVNLDAGEIFPSPKKYGALIVMGGPPSANDSREQTPWMPTELTRIQEALTEGVPYLGVCLGMQTLVKAAGGEITRSPRKEVGFRETYGEPLGKFYSIQLTDEGKKDPLFEGVSDAFPMFHLHGETVELPLTMQPHAKLLGTADAVPNQIVKVGENAYGTQGHFELSPQMLEEWLSVDPDLLNLGERGVEQVRKDFQEIQEEYTRNATKIFSNFLNLIK